MRVFLSNNIPPSSKNNKRASLSNRRAIAFTAKIIALLSLHSQLSERIIICKSHKTHVCCRCVVFAVASICQAESSLVNLYLSCRLLYSFRASPLAGHTWYCALWATLCSSSQLCPTTTILPIPLNCARPIFNRKIQRG